MRDSIGSFLSRLPSYQEIAYRASGGSYDEHAGRVSELRRKDSTLASGIREYQPGDRLHGSTGRRQPAAAS
ncbi:hypothetical protein PO124_25890 [Bacillus licheniformis]|nr:hypothetical protein [Bacillus licheniformis]